jgi:diacylglycerol kinase family enzyme
VVAVGGDGSVNEVANGLRGRDAALAILSVGTANVVAGELGMPHDADTLARSIVSGRTRAIDVGLCEARRFLLGLGAGLDAAVVARVHARRVRRPVRSGFSMAAYVLPAMETVLDYPFPRIRVVADGQVLTQESPYVVVGNCRFTGGALRLTPRACVDDGLLDVAAFHDLNPLRLGWLAASANLADLSTYHSVRYTRAREITLESDDGGDDVPVQIDGDPAGSLPRRVRVEAAALRVVCP